MSAERVSNLGAIPRRAPTVSYAVQYAVKAQTSLAPLSRFRGSRFTTAHTCAPMLYAKTATRAYIYDLPWAARARAPSLTELAGLAADSPSVYGTVQMSMPGVSAMNLGNLRW